MLVPRTKPVFLPLFAAALTAGFTVLPAPAPLQAEPPAHAAPGKKKGSGKEKDAPAKSEAATPATAATPAPTVPDAAPAESPSGPVAGPEPAGLTAEQISSAATLDALTVPTPGELFAAMTKQTKPTWSSQFRGPISASYSDRTQIALNLGGLIADGYVAVEAQDAQQVKNLGRDIIGLTKTLGISKEILSRANSITQAAEDNDWNRLKEELEATQNDVKAAMDDLHDEELVTLLSLGGWVRGTQIVSSVVLKNFSEQTASILRQPAIVDFLRAKMDALSPKTKKLPLIAKLDAGLADIKGLVSFPLGSTATKENVQKLNDEAGELVKAITTKQ